MDEAQVVEHMALVTHDQPPKVAEPGEEPLDLPTPPLLMQRAPILRLGLRAAPTMRCDHLDTQLCQGCIQRVGIVGPVADQAAGQGVYKAGVERGGDEADLVRRSRGGTSGERKTKAVCHCHELRAFAPLGRSHAAPSLGDHEGAVDEAFGEIEPTSVFEVLG